MRFRDAPWAGRWAGVCRPLSRWRLWKARSTVASPALDWCIIPIADPQYASKEYVERLESISAVLSMSRAGRPWENGRCESFLKTLKQEEIDARPYHSLEELEQHIAEFIEQIYNRVRLHSALGYQSPAEFENRLVQPGTVPAWLPAGLSLRRHEEVPVLGQPPEGQP